MRDIARLLRRPPSAAADSEASCSRQRPTVAQRPNRLQPPLTWGAQAGGRLEITGALPGRREYEPEGFRDGARHAAGPARLRGPGRHVGRRAAALGGRRSVMTGAAGGPRDSRGEDKPIRQGENEKIVENEKFLPHLDRQAI